VLLNLKNGWTDNLPYLLYSRAKPDYFYNFMKNISSMKVLFVILIILSYNSLVFCQVGELIWYDEFNSGELDLSNWSYETGTVLMGTLARARLIVQQAGNLM